MPYQSTHNTGGTMMGADPKSSAVNRYCQAWDAVNLFVMGASLFPQNASYTWSISGRILTLKAKEDLCADRDSVLQGRWTRVGR